MLGKDNKFSVNMIPKLTSFLQDKLSKRINKYMLPNKRSLKIPFTKKETIC